MVGKKKPTKSKKKCQWNWKKIITMAICIVIPLIVGGTSGAIAGNAMSKFGSFNQPPLAPPAWLFPVAWTILYILMGIASYFIFVYKPKTKKEKKVRLAALILYCMQLAFNFAWSPIFFLAGEYILALAWLIVMWLMIVVIVLLARKRFEVVMWLLLPYIMWCLFAMYLNANIMLLN